MSLTEAQIQRYSRQILLRGLGGVGQAKLLEGAVEVMGEGPALETAVAYLLAGGCPVRRDGRWLPGVDPARGAKTGETVALHGAFGLVPPAGGAVVCIGALGLAYRSADGCLACFGALGSEGPPPRGARATLAGTLAALLCQRLILGALSGVGWVPLEGEGALTAVPSMGCAACRGGR